MTYLPSRVFKLSEDGYVFFLTDNKERKISVEIKSESQQPPILVIYPRNDDLDVTLKAINDLDTSVELNAQDYRVTIDDETGDVGVVGRE